MVSKEGNMLRFVKDVAIVNGTIEKEESGLLERRCGRVENHLTTEQIQLGYVSQPHLVVIMEVLVQHRKNDVQRSLKLSHGIDEHVYELNFLSLVVSIPLLHNKKSARMGLVWY